jgi:putative phosphoribosyl transferase
MDLSGDRAVVFVDRTEAGRRLAQQLLHRRDENAVVLGLPRGGLPVAFEVARALNVPLDVIVVRKLGVPFQPELAMGAIGEGGVRVVDPLVVSAAGVSAGELAAVETSERAELERRARRYRGNRPRIDLRGRTAIVIDDGIATGSTAEAACQVARALGASRVILAVPVGPRDSIARLRDVADDVVCLETPVWFFAVGEHYRNFSQLSDDDVVDLLERAAAGPPATATPAPSGVGGDPPTHHEEVTVSVGQIRVQGHLALPDDAAGVVIFAHGSGSSRHSPRNRLVASVLEEAELGTLLFDLLTPAEELSRTNVFDIDLLGRRLLEVTHWLQAQPFAEGRRVAYFGASTGAAAALWAAADPACDVAAVVSRGGRPDLAASRLAEVRAPTLLIVGDRDRVVLELNREAQARLRCKSQLTLVAGATHLFEEPGALEEVARLARDWFRQHLIGAPHDPSKVDVASSSLISR